MEIKKTLNDNTLVIELSGRLDTITAPLLEEELKKSIENVHTLIYDLKELSYISSSGLRVLLLSQKIMNNQGNMIIRNVAPDVKEVLDITGFSSIITIE